MSPAVASFVSSLRAYDPSADASPILALYPLVQPIEEEASVPEAFNDIFAFFERYPDADLGAPGPLVHLLESHLGQYEELLAASLRRNPSVATVTMAHRILNALRNPKERSDLMGLLVEAIENPAASEHVRSEARHYHEYQSKG